MRILSICAAFLLLFACEGDKSEATKAEKLEETVFCDENDQSDAVLRGLMLGEWSLDSIMQQTYVKGDAPYPNCAKGCSAPQVSAFPDGFVMLFTDNCRVYAFQANQFWAKWGNISTNSFEITLFNTNPEAKEQIDFEGRAEIIELTGNYFEFRYLSEQNDGENIVINEMNWYLSR